jgi:hypothetical protein
MKAILITNEEIKRFSPIKGNLDDDKLSSYIEVAQDIHLQNYLGTKLYDAIQTYAINDTMPATYDLLIESYIKPMLMRWALVEYMPFAAYTISNNGVFKHNSENSEIVTVEEVDGLTLKYTNLAKHYTKRLIDFLCHNSTDYPEFNDNVGADMRPSRNGSYGGIYLD